MLRLSAEQFDWILTQQRERLAQALMGVLTTQWPSLATKLGDRSAAFIDTALQQAHRCGLTQATHAARYVNLWCVWGPAFDDKADFAWAADILQDDRRTSAVKIQQLVLHSRDVLEKRAAAGMGVKELDAADVAMESAVQAVSVAAWIEGTQTLQAEPRQPCDLTGFDLALGDQTWRQEYRLAWNGKAVLAQHMPFLPPAQRYRIDVPLPPGVPVPRREVAALAEPPQKGHRAWLHLRCEVADVCDEHEHPRVEIKANPSGRVFAGRHAHLIKWPLYYINETSAELSGLCRELPAQPVLVFAETCGLRRMGAPLGTQEAMVSVYPAAQWLAEFSTAAQPVVHLPRISEADAPVPARIGLACDGRSRTVSSWEAGWAAMPAALAQGVETWYNTLSRDESLLAPRLTFDPQLMHGQAAWTWGAREAVTGSGSMGFLRVAAILRMVACASDAVLKTELKHGGAHARITLQATGRAVMAHDVVHESPEKPLADALSQLTVQWRFPWTVQVESLSSPQLATLAGADSSTLGALTGEAGLRPCPDGKGWQWFCRLKLEPAVLNLTLSDPLLGVTAAVQRTLWPAMVLLDWSAG